MKKFALLAVLAGISATAAAQSNVTLFGVLDANARYVKNGDLKLKSLGSNGASISSTSMCIFFSISPSTWSGSICRYCGVSSICTWRLPR